MQFGVYIAGPAKAPPYERVPLADFGRAAEANGFESVIFAGFTHGYPGHGYPEGLKVDLAARPGSDLIGAYLWDPVVGMTAVAMATTTLKVGTGVMVVNEYDPILLAREIATLDQLSGGRVIFGVGAGWDDREFRDHGLDPAFRGRIFMEKMRAIKEIWTHDKATFHGQHVNFDDVMSWPKPLQQPHPEIMYGGHGPGILGRCAELGATWYPSRNRVAKEEIFRRMAEVDGIRVTTNDAVQPFGSDEIAEYVGHGVYRCLFLLGTQDGIEAMQEIERLGRLIAPFSDR
jgi:probable F420-dependent oxidoreductase